MEQYTFSGIINGSGLLCVKSNCPIGIISGFRRVKNDGDDTVHSFIAGNCVKDEQVGGFYYAWYRVSNYSAEKNNSAAVERKEAKNAANIDYLAMMTGVDIPEEA